MALARKCDICGKFHNIYNTKQSNANHNALRFLNVDRRDAFFESGIVDCCPECMDSIKLHIGKLTEKKEKDDG